MNMPIAARPPTALKAEATISDINAVKAAAKEVGGLKKLEVMARTIAELMAKTGGIDKIVQSIDFLKGEKKTVVAE